MALALNTNNDIFSEKGSIRRVYSSSQVVQNVRTRLLTYLGECFLDTTRGTDWFGKVFIKPINLSTAETEIKRIIIQTRGVETLDNLELTFDSATRLLTVSFGATTTDGDAISATINRGV